MKTKSFQLSLFWKICLPIIIIIPIGVIVQVLFIKNSTHDATVKTVRESSINTINQFKTIRSYYTKNIIKKINNHGDFSADYIHKDQKDKLPLPATFIHELSEEFKKDKNGTELNLYSKFPFPNRKERKLDSFQEEAIKFFEKSPKEVFVKAMTVNNEEVLRVAIADTMSAQACVDCHNAHPETPFDKWKLGDVRGVLEVKTSIQNAITDNSNMINTLTLATAIVGLLLVSFLAMIIKVLVLKPTQVITGQLIESANMTNSRSSELKDLSGKVSSATTQQASAIQETVATLDEISAMVEQGVSSASETNKLTDQGVDAAEVGRKTMRELIIAIEDIEKSNDNISTEVEKSNNNITEIITVIKEISDKTKVINDIVFQTKLLSFNASVEAARAGEHGKGFAVVAEEIGSLAQMSGNAANEISQMLNDSVGKVESIVNNTKSNVKVIIDNGKSKIESGVLMAQRSQESLSDIVDKVKEIKIMMSKITEAAKDQAEGVSNISAAMNELDSVTQLNSQVAQETADTSDGLLEQAEHLKELVKNLESELLGK